MEIQVGPLSKRAMSSFALSIGTALAFESLFKGSLPAYDPERKIPQHIHIKEYDEMWINISTLIRNIYSSVSTADQNHLMAVDLYMTLESEIDTLRGLIQDGSLEKTKFILYATDDSRMKARHPHALIRYDTTDKQRMYNALKDVVLQEYLKRHRHIPGVYVFHEKLTPEHKHKALILTHDAYDLLSWPAFSELHLLESHTGLLKKKPQWYTKFANGKDLMRIPFNSCFLQVFGDSLHFHPFPLKDRLAVKELADQRDWTALTSKDRLILSFQLMQDQVLGKILQEMLSE
jgi:hypothetical protein